MAADGGLLTMRGGVLGQPELAATDLAYGESRRALVMLHRAGLDLPAQEAVSVGIAVGVDYAPVLHPPIRAELCSGREARAAPTSRARAATRMPGVIGQVGAAASISS